MLVPVGAIWMSLLTGVMGGLISGLVTGLLFYLLAGRRLQVEAQNLRRLNTLILHALEEAGQIQLNRDASDNIIGFTLQLSGFSAGMSQMAGDPTIEKKSAPKKA